MFYSLSSSSFSFVSPTALQPLLRIMISSRVSFLPAHIQAVFLHNTLKLFVSALQSRFPLENFNIQQQPDHHDTEVCLNLINERVCEKNVREGRKANQANKEAKEREEHVRCEPFENLNLQLQQHRDNWMKESVCEKDVRTIQDDRRPNTS